MNISKRARFLAVIAAGGLIAPAQAIPPMAVSLVLATQPEADVPTMRDAGALFQQQKFAEAAELYEQIVKAEPENAQAWFQMGYCLHVTGELDRAIPAHIKAAELSPSGTQFHALGLYNLGCAYALQGESDKSFEALMRAVEGGFSTTENFQTVGQDTDLDSLRGDARFARFTERMRSKGRSATLKQFDFWLGSWDVYNRDGKRMGTNIIEASEGGLAIMESWTSASGGTGRSLSYFEPVARVWKQVWIDSKGVLETSGTWEDGSLNFRGERKTHNGQVKQHRMSFTPDGHGNVRQLIQESDDGENWEVFFDGLYVPMGSDSPGAWGSEAQADSELDASAEPAVPAEGSLEGAWIMVVDQSQGDPIELLLTFTREDGEIHGVAEAMGAQMELEKVVLEGDELSMSLVAPDGLVYEFEGLLRANTIKGAWQDEAGDSVDATATRDDI